MTTTSLVEVQEPTESESGYVMAMTALLLVPLMLFAALAVDIGAWFVRADQTQRAADAAALAGTVWLPDVTRAEEVALDVAARNGFRDPAWVALNGGTANATVTSPGVTASGGLQVNITIDSPSYFGAVVLNTISITRISVASVIPPVRMGNPTNALGTGNLDGSELGTTPDGVWLSLNGWCQDHAQGDPVSVGRFGATQAGGRYWDTCNSATLGANPTHDPRGYTFVVDVPAGAAQIDLEVFEPGICGDPDPNDLLYSAGDAAWGGPRLNFRVYGNDATPYDHEDNLATSPLTDVLYASNACSGGTGPGGRWYHLYSIPSGSSSEGLWYIQANVRQNVNEGGLNNFSIRARPVGTTALCSSMANATCPQLYALDWLSIFRPNFGGSSSAGQPAEFFLAEVSDEHAGKQIEVTMFDPGEGMNNFQFLDPHDNEVEFEFRRVNCSVGLICVNPSVWPDTAWASQDWCSTVPCLDVTGSRFQDQWVQTVIDLPPGYTCNAGNCWWKVRYTPNTGVTVSDRTTWGIRVIGGPVRLVE